MKGINLFNRCPNCGQKELHAVVKTPAGIVARIKSIGKKKNTIIECENCGYQETELPVIVKK